MENNIADVDAIEVLDSRGNPTIEVEVKLQNGSVGRAIVPSGASTGEYEAYEMRDDGARYAGKGVEKAVKNVCTTLRNNLLGKNGADQHAVDRLMIEIDGTTQKKNIGANAILGVSLALAHANACATSQSLYQYLGQEKATMLPVPMMNILNGGAHADNPIDIQEFMIMPIGASCFKEALRTGVEVFHVLKSNLKQAGYGTNVGDEGGFAPNLSSSRVALDFICRSIEEAGFTLGDDFVLALDCASSELYHDHAYHLKGEKLTLSSLEMGEYLKKLSDDYPIFSIEDGLDENDWEGWQNITKLIGDKIQLVGDDLFVTNSQKLQQAIDTQTANAILIKPNQIGTLSETKEAIAIAQKNQYQTVMSHRSGESEDCTIADLAVGYQCYQIKTGAPSRADRTAKYNRLLRIEKQLGKKARYAGSFLKNVR